jgi:hypothetical protein
LIGRGMRFSERETSMMAATTVSQCVGSLETIKTVRE